jgi:hypothetical protein
MQQSCHTTWRKFATCLALTGVLLYATLLPWSAAMQQAAAVTLANFAKDLAHSLCTSQSPIAEGVEAPALPAPQSETCEICKAVGCTAFAVILPESVALPFEFVPTGYAQAQDDQTLASSSIPPRSRAPPIPS